MTPSLALPRCLQVLRSPGPMAGQPAGKGQPLAGPVDLVCRLLVNKYFQPRGAREPERSRHHAIANA
jgi:hypothetical protein